MPQVGDTKLGFTITFITPQFPAHIEHDYRAKTVREVPYTPPYVIAESPNEGLTCTVEEWETMEEWYIDLN